MEIIIIIFIPYETMIYFLELKISDMDEWMESDDDSDSSGDEDEESKNKKKNDGEDSNDDSKKKKGKKVKPDKKKKRDLDGEAFEESDDGDEEGREVIILQYKSPLIWNIESG